MYIKSKQLRLIRENLEAGKLLGASIRASGMKSTYTVDKWRHEFPRIDRYLKACIKRCDDRRVRAVEDALFKSAIEGNTTAMIFFLTNRSMSEWADRRNLIHTGTFKNGETRVVIVYPPKNEGSNIQPDPKAISSPRIPNRRTE